MNSTWQTVIAAVVICMLAATGCAGPPAGPRGPEAAVSGEESSGGGSPGGEPGSETPEEPDGEPEPEAPGEPGGDPETPEKPGGGSSGPTEPGGSSSGSDGPPSEPADPSADGTPPEDPPAGGDLPGDWPGPDHVLALVNKTYALPEDYVPEDLVIPDVPFVLAMEEIKHMRAEAARALEDLFAAAGEEGYDLRARSGFRSYNTQKSLFDGYVQRHGREAADRFSARAGHSEHQTGLAMDITSPSVGLELKRSFGDTEEGRWVHENAHRFGFIIRYPRDGEDVTGYVYEPWHLRYVGPRAAKAIYEQDVTLEEYIFSLFDYDG